MFELRVRQLNVFLFLASLYNEFYKMGNQNLINFVNLIQLKH